MEKRLQPQLKIKNELDAVLKNVEVSFKSHDDRDVQTLLVYMPLDGNPDPLNKFFSVVKEGILPILSLSAQTLKDSCAYTRKVLPRDCLTKLLGNSANIPRKESLVSLSCLPYLMSI